MEWEQSDSILLMHFNHSNLKLWLFYYAVHYDCIEGWKQNHPIFRNRNSKIFITQKYGLTWSSSMKLFRSYFGFSQISQSILPEFNVNFDLKMCQISSWNNQQQNTDLRSIKLMTAFKTTPNQSRVMLPTSSAFQGSVCTSVIPGTLWERSEWCCRKTVLLLLL